MRSTQVNIQKFGSQFHLSIIVVSLLGMSLISFWSSQPTKMAEETSLDQEVESSLASHLTSFSEVDVNLNQRPSSVLLNEFNHLPWL